MTDDEIIQFRVLFLVCFFQFSVVQNVHQDLEVSDDSEVVPQIVLF